MKAQAKPRVGNDLVNRVAQTLIDDGYDAITFPAPHLLPADIARWQPDILARRGSERVVVAVKEIPSPESTEHISGLARAVQSHPGWHFQLATAPREEGFASWTFEAACARVDEAESIMKQGHPEAALLLLVAAAEAMARQLADREGLRVRRWNPRALFGQLVHQGLLTHDDAALLDRARAARNLLVHGADSEADAVARVAELIHAVRRLAAEMRVSHPAEAAAPHASPAK